jgi:exonuclease SbcD
MRGSMPLVLMSLPANKAGTHGSTGGLDTGERPMKILHTADIHLRNHEDERWQTLLKLVETGRKEKIDVMTISGDLFDRGVDAEKLRVRIRKVFSGNGFKIVMIPGNHDQQSYRQGIFLGEDTTILNDPCQPFELENISIWGLPFEQAEGEEILDKLNSISVNINPDRINILLYHGELLDTFYSRRDFGDEGEGRYMPVRLSYFNGMNIDYVLAGHFHSRFDIRKLEEGGYFVYPGSPVSITRRETGQRRVNIFEAGAPPQEHILDTPHFENLVIELDPLSEESPEKAVIENLDRIHPHAQVILTVTGYINSRKSGITEEKLADQIREISGDRIIETQLDFRDIGTILEDDLFKEFNEKLNRLDYDDEEKGRIREMAIRAMMESKQ